MLTATRSSHEKNERLRRRIGKTGDWATTVAACACLASAAFAKGLMLVPETIKSASGAAVADRDAVVESKDNFRT
jgi:hypothetical protein